MTKLKNYLSADEARRGPQKNNQYGFKGAYPTRSGKWQSQICIDKHRIHLGTFNTRDEAHAAYCAAANNLHGEFARHAT
jgi:hypothetical protein